MNLVIRSAVSVREIKGSLGQKRMLGTGAAVGPQHGSRGQRAVRQRPGI